MSYLKQNVNFAITIFLIIAIIVLVAASIFFHLILNDLSNKFESARGQIEEINSTLTEAQVRGEETEEELQLRTERESHLSTEFSKIQTDNQGLLKSKESLESQVASARNDAAKYQREVSNLNRDLQAVETELNELRAAVFTMTSNLNTCNSQRRGCEEDLSDCQESCP